MAAKKEKSERVPPGVLKFRAELGAALKRLRGDKTLEEVAVPSGIDAGNLSRIERGQQGISDLLLYAIAEQLGTTIADLYRPKNTPALGGDMSLRDVKLMVAREWLEMLSDEALDRFKVWAKKEMEAASDERPKKERGNR